MKTNDKQKEGIKKEKSKYYRCPDCGRKHQSEAHPPYCESCILEITL